MSESPPGWTRLPTEHLPPPTFWPAGLAFGLTLLFWGLISSWVILAAGIIVMAASLRGWIRAIRLERKRHS
ncbi:MAG TPA: hypothetical protein VGF85_09545 [Opitutaceae bacterium]|jgi:hypothetical protein